jgi:hypothetical protein
MTRGALGSSLIFGPPTIEAWRINASAMNASIRDRLVLDYFAEYVLDW